MGRCGKIAFALAVAVLAGAVHAEPNTAASIPLPNGIGGSSLDLHFDRNGRFAVFWSDARNLIPGQDTGGNGNIFLYDRSAGTLRLVSHVPGEPARGGDQGAVFERSPQISADGGWVAYSSASTDLVAGQEDGNAASDVFLWNRASGTTVLVSHRAGAPAAAGSAASTTSAHQLALSDDGRFLAYASVAADLVAGQTANAASQLYLFDRQAGTSVLVSHAAASLLQSAGDRSELPPTSRGRALSGDGRFLAFISLAADLVTGITDTNGNFDVYLWDRDADLASSLRLLSRRSGAPLATGNGSSDQSVISADGNVVAFVTRATNSEGVGSDANGGADVVRYDRAANQVVLVSHSAAVASATGNGAALFPVLSADGSQVAFESVASNLVPLQADVNGVADVFVWRAAAIELASHAPGTPATAANGASRGPLMAADGSVAFSSAATNLIAGGSDTNGDADVFYRPRGAAGVLLASHVLDDEATAGDNQSFVSDVLPGGVLVAFDSTAQDLVEGPLNLSSNVFSHGSLLMADGFESGDLTAWSQHFP